MPDAESKDLDARFHKLREAFEARRSDAVKEAEESFGWKSDSGRGEFETARHDARLIFSQAAELQTVEAEEDRMEFTHRTAAMEEETIPLRTADQKLTKVHKLAQEQTLLEKAGFDSDE